MRGIRPALIAWIAIAAITLVACGEGKEKIGYSEAVLLNGEISVSASAHARQDALYQIGSISKFACTLAIMDMEREGLVSLSDPIEKLLPQWAGPIDSGLELQHLLQNRSGLPDGVMQAFREDQSLTRASMDVMDAANAFASGRVKFGLAEAAKNGAAKESPNVISSL